MKKRINLYLENKITDSAREKLSKNPVQRSLSSLIEELLWKWANQKTEGE